MRYLGIYVSAARNFKCNLSDAKKSFYRSFNAIFGKVGRRASEEVVLHLVTAKCLPVLLYSLDVIPVNKSDIKSLEFALDSVFMKLFDTRSGDVITVCKLLFSVGTVYDMILRRKRNFVAKLFQHSNCIIRLFDIEATALYNSLYSSDSVSLAI
jgi:hypothetical protein